MGKVVTMYSKTAGKCRKYASIMDSSSIPAISKLGIQGFENSIANAFSATSQATTLLDMNYFQLITSIQFLVVLLTSSVIIQKKRSLVLDNSYLMSAFRNLKSQERQLTAALKVFNAREGILTDKE
ncbi:hypothetical protein BDQ17DRAFT_1315812 [Cyathus striatus]|nr:hypothetical protein BDQ17DRAFT_1315812 [Cyathus striatus]